MRNKTVKKMVAIVMALILLFETLIWGAAITVHGNSIEFHGSEELTQAIYDASDYYCICPELLMAICERESSAKHFQRDGSITRNGNCYGAFQISSIHEEWAESLGYNIYEVYGNTMMACEIFFDIMESSGIEDVPYVLDRYHGDSKAYKRYQNNEISPYARKIMERAEQLERLGESVG